MNIYDEKFYIENYDTYNPNVILPLIIDAVKPSSVIDIGCAECVWLSVFKKLGVNDVLGVDGEYVNKERILIDKDLFIPYDLEKKFVCNRRFDLAYSLEVAEHISKENASVFVESLTDLSDVVMFSAATPFQGGTFHINEQWQSYWIELFKEKGYIAIDYIRPRICNDLNIKLWYRQNIMIFVKESMLAKYPLLAAEYNKNKTPASYVVPELFLDKLGIKEKYNPYYDRAINSLEKLLIRLIPISKWRKAIRRLYLKKDSEC